MKTLALVFQNADTPQVIDLMRRTFEEVLPAVCRSRRILWTGSGKRSRSAPMCWW